jgi:hypothetical protein
MAGGATTQAVNRIVQMRVQQGIATTAFAK